MAQQLRHAMLREASAVQAHARGGDESFSGIVKDASHHHGKVPLSTGAWYLTDEYVAKAISKCPEATVREEGVQACTYKLDVGLAACLSVFFTGATVTELGAGVGRYTRFLQASGRTRGVVAYDGMPDVENKSRGIVHWADLSEPRLLLAPGVIHGARDGAAANPQPAIPHPEAPRPKGCLGSSWPRTARIQSDRHRLASTWVMSLEVAEHIPRRFEASFMRNVDCANTRGAVISWSSITQRQGGVGHVNARSRREVVKIFGERGYKLDENATSTLRKCATKGYFRRGLLVLNREGPRPHDCVA